MTEAELQQVLIEALRTAGWHCHHETDSRRTKPGWPDIVALGTDGRLFVAELKTASGKVSPAQKEWLESWGAVQGRLAFGTGAMFVGVVRPDDLPAVLEWISG